MGKYSSMYSQEKYIKNKIFGKMHAQAVLPRIKPCMTTLQGSKTLHIRSDLASSVMESNSDEGTLG